MDDSAMTTTFRDTVLSGLGLASRFPFLLRSRPRSVSDRLGAYPPGRMPLHAPAEVRFDDLLIPYVHAGDDRDLPFLLGVVHAFLRLGQMELFRATAAGRLCELFGSPAMRLDASLRRMGLTRAVPAMLASLSPATSAWIERYAQGVSFMAAKSRGLSSETDFYRSAARPWTPADVLAVGRLISSDINWLFWLVRLRAYREPGWPGLWERMTRLARCAAPSFVPDAADGLNALWDVLGTAQKSGSNCVAVAGARTRNGAGLLAGDAHVQLSLPPLWCVAALNGPGFAAAGMTIPGVPAVLVGRNRHIAWGGTNMLALQSIFYDVSRLPASAFREVEEKAEVRFCGERAIRYRECDFGPVISDAPLLAALNLPPLALSWRGHRASDEIGAMLAVNRAGNFGEFRAAFEPWAVSGQHFLYADAHGGIGQVAALEFDPAASRAALDFLGDPADPAHAWGEKHRSTELPAVFAPEDGLLVSANNPAFGCDPALTLFEQSDDRYHRLRERILAATPFGPEQAFSMQQDTHCATSLTLARRIRLAALRIGPPQGTEPLLDALAAWDGCYETDSRGAAALELTAHALARRIFPVRHGHGPAAVLMASPAALPLLAEDVGENSPLVLDNLAPALSEAALRFARYPDWGTLHHVVLKHPLASLPIAGRAFAHGREKSPGGTLTVHKTATPLTGGPHDATYGATARHVHDLADEDENFVSLLGGQDGVAGSESFLSFARLWRRGEYVTLPLRPATAKKRFPHAIPILPGGEP